MVVCHEATEITMDEILELARRLGKRIADDPRGKAFREAQAALVDNAEAQKLLTEYNDQAHRIQSLEDQNKPIEPDDKRKLADAQQRVAGNACLANYAKVQADYVELMQRVSTAIENPGAAEG